MRLCNMRSSIRIMLGDTFFSFLFVISPFFVFSFSYNVAKWTQFRKAKDRRKKDFSQKLERYRLRGARKNEVAGKWMNRFMEPVCIYIVVSNVHQHFNNKHISVAFEKKYRIFFCFGFCVYAQIENEKRYLFGMWFTWVQLKHKPKPEMKTKKQHWYWQKN